MSSTPLDLPVLISQLPYVARIAHVQKASPEMQRDLFGPIINEHLMKAKSKVQEVEKKEKTSPVDRDGRQQQEQQAQSGRKQHDDEEPEATDTGSANPSPWAGNIVDVKI